MMFAPTNYPYFFFPELPFNIFYEKLQPELSFESVEHARRVYDRWLNIYHNRSNIFYAAQYSRHQEALFKSFRKEYGLPEDTSPSEYGMETEWANMRQVTGLDEHYEKYLEVRDYLAMRLGEPRAIPASEWIAERMKNPVPVLAINTLWFNTVINNLPSLVAELNRLPYEKYRMTLHWAKVRAAMLLIHRAVCQAAPHFMLGESWYGGGWESEIHVHHLSYANRGNERYEDLVLLCHEHHTLWHKSMDETGEPGFEILDNDVM